MKKVTTPPRISRARVDPRSVMLKNASRMPPGPPGRRGLLPRCMPLGLAGKRLVVVMILDLLVRSGILGNPMP